MRIMHRRSPTKREVLVRMFKESDARFMHWVVRAILNWQSVPLDSIPVYHIHGSRDIMIPARRVQPDVLIPGGGHLINVSRADEVNAFIAQAAAACTASNQNP
jgi:pimeloyl-ACP methyl ester carboxylesterase